MLGKKKDENLLLGGKRPLSVNSSSQNLVDTLLHLHHELCQGQAQHPPCWHHKQPAPSYGSDSAGCSRRDAHLGVCM